MPDNEAAPDSSKCWVNAVSRLSGSLQSEQNKLTHKRMDELILEIVAIVQGIRARKYRERTFFQVRSEQRRNKLDDNQRFTWLPREEDRLVMTSTTSRRVFMFCNSISTA